MAPPPHATLDAKKIEGRSYVPLAKKDLNIHRVLWGGTDHGSTVQQYRDLIYGTTVIEDIKALKDEKWAAEWPTDAGGQRRYRGRAARARRLSLPLVTNISTPSYGDVEGITMSVELSEIRRAVLVELLPETLEYIRKALVWQLDHREERAPQRARVGEEQHDDIPKGVHVFTNNTNVHVLHHIRGP